MSNILFIDQPYVLEGLGTISHTIASTGNYNVRCNITEIPPSSLAIIVQKNAVTIYTAPVVSTTQSALQFKTSFQATAADAITIVLSSGAAVDNELNNIKTNCSIASGF